MGGLWRKAGEEEDWKKKTGDRGWWKRLADEAVKNCRQHLTPDKGKKRKRERILCRRHTRQVLSRSECCGWPNVV